ncbi:hypothetical protein GIB67_029765 [Kingdonia uniflora]|uniref:Uncharacterized protein n=1 Tax=Kingdonia uniflora TaxID=39325 RepID=A0A7J7NIX7_9MAGN|nr:hypothetical protein GIB67_029765 [Kingdonia uniflora]
MFNLCRSSREGVQGQDSKSTKSKNESLPVRTLLPPPPSSKKSVSAEASMVDYLSGDMYGSENASNISQNSNNTHVSSPQAPKFTFSSPESERDTSPPFIGQPKYDEPPQTAKPLEPLLPSAPWEVKVPTSLPPPPAKYNQRQQFFEQHSSSGSTSPVYDGLAAQAQNLSLSQGKKEVHDSGVSTKQAKPEDALFKDLLDFAKSKPSPSSSKPTSHRTH